LPCRATRCDGAVYRDRNMLMETEIAGNSEEDSIRLT